MLRWICLSIGLLQVFLVFSPSPVLIVWPDSINHIGPAVDGVERGEFSYWPASGGFVYPLLLWGLLSIAAEPWIIIATQRLLVIGTFVALAATIGLLHRHAGNQERIRPSLAWLIAAFWLLVYVLYPPVIGLAQTVMPETLFALLLSLSLAGVVVVIVGESTARRKAVVAAAATFLGVAVVFVKPHWLLCAIGLPMVLPLLVGRRHRVAVAGGVLTGVAVAAVLVVVPDALWQRKSDASFARVFGPRSLFCNSSDLVQPYLATQTDTFDVDISGTLAAALTPESRAAAIESGWGLMGFNGDRCTHGEAARAIATRFAGRPSAEVAYYLKVYLAALTREPLYLVNRLGRQLGSLAAKPFNAVQGGNFLIADGSILKSSRALRPTFERWLVQHPETFDGDIVLPTRSALFALRVFFGVAGLALTTTMGLAMVLALRRAWLRRGKDTDLAVIVLASCCLAVNGLIATVHILEPRYLVIQTPLFALTGYLSSVTLMQRW